MPADLHKVVLLVSRNIICFLLLSISEEEMKEEQDSPDKNDPDEQGKDDDAGEISQGSYISISFLMESD